jgi:translocation and assembly module TamB
MDGSSAPPARPSRGAAGRGWRRGLFAVLFPLLLGFAGTWLAATEAGLGVLAAAARALVGPALEIEGLEGRLTGPLRLQRLEFQRSSWRLAITELSVDWRPADLLAGRLTLDEVRAGQLDLAFAPSGSAATPPAALTLPLGLTVARLQVARLRLLAWSGAAERLLFEHLSARAASDGRHHRLEAFESLTPWGRLSLTGGVDGQFPFPLAASAALLGERVGRDYRLTGEASGTLGAIRLALAGEGAGLAGTGWVEAGAFDPQPLARLELDLRGMDPAAFNPVWPAAALDLTASLARDDGGGLAGPVSIINRSPARLDQGGLPLARAEARLNWGEALSLAALRLSQPKGGELAGQGAWRDGQLSARLQARDLDLAGIHNRLPATRLSGPLTLATDPGSQSLVAHLAEQGLALDLTARREGALLRLEALRLAVGPGVLQATGEVGLEGARAFRLAGTLKQFDPARIVPGAPAGRLDLALEAAGRLAPEPRGQLSYRVAPGRLGGQPVAGEGRLELAAGRLTVPVLWLSLGLNRLEARGALGEGAPGLSLVADLPRLEQIAPGLLGRAGLELRFSGKLTDPAIAGHGYGERLVLPMGLRVAGVNFQGEWGAGTRGPVLLVAGASGLGRAGVAEDDLAGLALAWTGRRDEHRLVVTAQPVQGEGWHGHLAGGLVVADGIWRGQVVALQGPQAASLVLEAPASLAGSWDGLVLGPTHVRLGAGRVDLEETRWSPAETVLRGRFQGLGLGPAGGPATLRLGGSWDLRLGRQADGYLRIRRASGDWVVAGDDPTGLGLREVSLDLALQANRLSASLEAQGERLGGLAAQVSAWLERGAGGWRLAPGGSLQGSGRLRMPDLAWVGPLASPTLRTEGALEADFSLAGTPAAPLATGRVRGRGLGLLLGDLGLALRGGELEAEFDRERLRLARLEFVSPNRGRPRDGRVPVAALTAEPGRLSVTGEVELARGAGRFQFSAQRLPLLQRPDRWLVVSGKGEARTGWSSLDLSARLQADGGYLGLAERPAPSLSDDVVILGRHGAAGAATTRFSADVSVDLGRQLYLSALGVDTRLEGSLRLVAKSGQPLAATGTLSTVGGVFEGYGQKLTIERGRVNFLGPLDNPGMNIVALRKGLAVEAGLAITGTARRPRVQLVSEPQVPDTEKLAWIVLGRAPDSASGGDLALLIPAAQALLAGPGGRITDALAGSLGLDQLAVGQGERQGSQRGAASSVVGNGSTTAADTVSGQVLTLGKRLSSEVFLSFEQSLAGAESILRLSYQLSRRLAVVVRAGTDNGVDLTYSFSFR